MANAPISDSMLDSYVENERFSRKFEIPAGPEQSEPLLVSYSDFGYRDRLNPANERVLLFCSPLFGSRMLHIAKDELAKRHGVRIICPDRPGFGATSDVDLHGRVNTWLTIVPALLRHLDIKYVSIAAHSCGCIYALSTLLYSRNILHPTKPYVALCAPWVHPSHTGVAMTRFLGTLPEGILNQFGDAATFFNNWVGPMLNFSSGFGSGSQSAHKMSSCLSEAEMQAAQLEQRLGPKIMKRAYSENVQGLSSDAKLLLKRGVNADIWGPWVDHDQFVPLLAESEANRAPPEGALDQSMPLKIEIFFAEKDAMIGTSTGPMWFDECWRSEQRGNKIDYSSSTIAGTDHDSIVQIWSGVFQQIFARLSQ